MEKELVEVKVIDNLQLLKLQNVINCMKTMVYETADLMSDHVSLYPFSRGKNVGFCFRNGSGRSVNVICEHVSETLRAYFGEVVSLNEDGIKDNAVYTIRDFDEDYNGCAKAVMDYLIFDIVVPLK